MQPFRAIPRQIHDHLEILHKAAMRLSLEDTELVVQATDTSSLAPSEILRAIELLHHEVAAMGDDKGRTRDAVKMFLDKLAQSASMRFPENLLVQGQD